jgi:hypothetical protein
MGTFIPTELEYFTSSLRKRLHPKVIYGAWEWICVSYKKGYRLFV